MSGISRLLISKEILKCSTPLRLRRSSGTLDTSNHLAGIPASQFRKRLYPNSKQVGWTQGSASQHSSEESSFRRAKYGYTSSSFSTPLVSNVQHLLQWVREVPASEMLKLKEVILRSPSLRVLHLRFYRRATIHSDNSVLVCWTSFVNHSHPYRIDLLTYKANLNFLNLPFIPSDKLPPIQELRLWTQYNLNY